MCLQNCYGCGRKLVDKIADRHGDAFSQKYPKLQLLDDKMAENPRNWGKVDYCSGLQGTGPAKVGRSETSRQPGSFVGRLFQPPRLREFLPKSAARRIYRDILQCDLIHSFSPDMMGGLINLGHPVGALDYQAGQPAAIANLRPCRVSTTKYYLLQNSLAGFLRLYGR